MAPSLLASQIGTGGWPAEPHIGRADGEDQLPSFDPGELAPFPMSPYPSAELSDGAGKHIDALCDLVGNKDVAARRWEVEQSWEATLMDRGYQHLLPRRGGGWISPPFAASSGGSGSRQGGNRFYGHETNIVATYREIICAALTRDIPEVRFEPSDPMSDADITAACAATDYARVFARSNNLLGLHQQIAYYLSTDGRVILVTDHVLDAQRFGRQSAATDEPPAVPETEAGPDPALYVVRHGETEMNRDGQARGRSDVGLNSRGARQAQASADWLKTKRIPAIVSSPVQRAMESSDILSQATGAPVSTDDRLASLDVGDFAGGDSQAAREAISDQPSDEPIGGGESLDDFNGRVRQAFGELAEAAPPKTAVVVHDSVIASLYKMLHGDDVPAGALVPPGGVAAVYPQADGTMTIRQVFPAAPPAPASGQSRGMPKGMEVTEAFGKLESKVPINSQELRDMPFVQVCREYDVAHVKAMFPEFADKITPGQAGGGENELDRIARINACLALEASYVTGDSMVRDCTLQKTWLRPGFFMEVKDAAIRAELLRNFPDGALVIHAGKTRVLARNESMDDHLTLIQAGPGRGQNRLALMSKVLSVQKRLNNWLDLLNAFYIRTIPQRYFNSDIFDPEAIKRQGNEPGAYIPYTGAKLVELPNPSPIPPIWVEPSPTHQPSLPDFIKMFINDLPQLLSGALPSLFGSAANTDTVGGIAIQRDQALARLGTPWHNIQMATCSYHRQAAQLAARCRTESVRGIANGHAVRVEIADMRGNVLCYPASDANFPESWNQQQQRYQTLLQDASNPIVAAILASPANLMKASDLIGIPGFKIKQAVAYEKQLGELDKLLRGSPVPNPDYEDLAAHMRKMQAGLAQAQQAGMPDPQMQQQIDQGIQQLKGMPPEISTVPVYPSDDNATEAACLWDFLNGPEGRRLRNGTPEEKAAAQNAQLHMQQHEAADQAKQAGAPKQPPKPLSITANVKDLPPADAAAVLAAAGLPADPNSVAQGRELNAQIKKTSKVGE